MAKKSELDQYKHANKVQAQIIGELKIALQSIAKMGAGLKEDVIDWKNIGRNAVFTANDVLKIKCPTCGKKQ